MPTPTQELALARLNELKEELARATDARNVAIATAKETYKDTVRRIRSEMVQARKIAGVTEAA